MSAVRMMLPALPAAILLLLSGAARAEVNVIVTSKPVHALVSSVMAGVGAPELLVSGQTSPHTYAMRPSDAQKVHSAHVFFRVSEQLEPFTAKLVRSLPSSVRVVSLAEAPGLTLLERRDGGAFATHGSHHDHENAAHNHGHEHEHDHDHAGAAHDPHVWLDPDNAEAMVRHIAGVLAQVMPEKAAEIRANAEAEIGRIAALADELAQELTPVAGKPFIVYHDAYQYLENRFGLTAVGSLTVSPDLPPSGKRLQELRSLITSAGALCVFAEPYLSPRVTEVIVEGTSARTGLLDPEGTALEPSPDLYHVLMRNLARNIKDCLAGQ